MIRPDAREFRFHSFHPENTGLVMDLMLPMYEEVIENKASSCITSRHTLVMAVVKAILEDARNATQAEIALNPNLYGHLHQH